MLATARTSSSNNSRAIFCASMNVRNGKSALGCEAKHAHLRAADTVPFDIELGTNVNAIAIAGRTTRYVEETVIVILPPLVRREVLSKQPLSSLIG
jgi:hypothetical protein